MEERRKDPRIDEVNELTIIVDSEENNLSHTKIRDIFVNNFTTNISESGVGIKTNIHLSVDDLIELEFTSKGMLEQIKTLGKVKWVKVIIDDKSYEAGVEFYGAPGDATKKLGDYVSWKLKDRLNKKRLSSINSGDINIKETKEQPPIKSSDINTVETKELSPNKSSDINTADTKKLSPTKNKPWIKIVIISLCTIVLIVVLLTISGYIPEFDRLLFPSTNKIVTKNSARDSITTKSATLPAPPVAAPAPDPVLEATPAPVTASAPEVTQKIKVIGNSDSKRYHLRGMKYYNTIKAYHRVEFDSEEDAIKAGYNKAPQ